MTSKSHGAEEASPNLHPPGSRRSSVPRAPLPASLYQFCWAMAAMMGICFALNLYWRRVDHRYFAPYATPLFGEYFPDFVMFEHRFQYFHSLRFWTYENGYPFMYPAPVALLYKVFLSVPKHPLLVFLLVGLTAFSFAAVLLGRALVHRGVRPADAHVFPFIVLLCSSPFWFAAKQANMEIMIWAVVAAGLLCFLAGRGYSAAVCFGIAASLKIYPFVYLGLLFARRQYRQIGVAVATAIAVTLASLWTLYPDLKTSWQNTNAGVAKFRALYMLGKRIEIGADHSLFALFKKLLHPLPPAATMDHYLTLYLALAALGGLLLFFLRIRTLPLLNQILALTVASILLPPTSFEYTLLHLFVPFGIYTLLLVDRHRRGEMVPGIGLLLPCFALLLTFLADVIINDTLYGGQVKAVLLLGLFAYTLWKPLAGPDELAATLPQASAAPGLARSQSQLLRRSQV